MEISNLSVKLIKEIVEKKSYEDYPEMITILDADHRKSVNNLSKSLKKKINDQNKLVELYDTMKAFDLDKDQKLSLIGGIDEVGRGPFAGPVVAACVVLKDDFEILGIKDSKKLNEAKREELYDLIIENSVSYGVGIIDEKVIDKINILNATKLAMKEAISQLSVTPNTLLIDAVKLSDVKIKQHSIIKGDDLSLSIAAASIVAKVTRDRIVKAYAVDYPEYGFENHKGYGTKAHIDAIRKFGVLDVHRRSFIKNV